MVVRQPGGTCTLASLVERVAGEDPDRTALLAPQRAPLDYATLFEFLGSTTAKLRDCGVASSDRVALVVQNGSEAATAFLALASAAACAPLNPAYRREEMDFYLDDLKVRAVVVSSSLDSPVREAAEARGIAVLELDVDPGMPAGVFSLTGGALVSAATPARRAHDDLALFLHTSGTTSRPKLVPLTQRNLIASARNVSGTLALRPDDRCLNVMPLFHIHGLVAALLASMDAGSSVVCTPGFHPIRVFDWFREFRPTWTTAVPTMHQSLVARCADYGDVTRDHRLRFIRSSSASLPVTVFEELERTFGVPVIEAYGMTEAAHQMASNPLPPSRRKAGSVGPPAGPEIAILSPAGDLLPTGSTGEVAIRGESVFAGYEDNPDANAVAFANGWFRTGDEGALDEDGYLKLSGRLKEQINRGGEKVSPLEIDARLLAHPAVAEAAAFGVPDARLGEEVAAVVVLKADTDTTEPALQDFVAQTLAPFKVPRRILILDEIPKGPTGKIQRIGLAGQLGLSQLHEQRGDYSEPRSSFERSIARIFADVLRIPSVGINDDFFALGGDSILGAEAMARIREFTSNRDLPLVSIVRAPTVAAMVRELDTTGAVLARSGPIALRPDAAGDAFFFVHGGDGEVLNFVALARALGNERAMYGIRAQGIDDGETPPASIEEMAAGYVDAVRSMQQHGPYALGGFCLGGTVALEMTNQLVAAGEAVPALVLVDPRLPAPGDHRYRLWLAARLLRQRGSPRAALSRTLRRSRPDPAASWMSETERKIARMRESYEPKAYLGPAVVILSNQHEQYDIPEWHLRRVVPNARTVRLDLDHTPMLQSPGVDTLAREMRIALGLGIEPPT